MTTATPSSFIESVKEMIGSERVFVFCKVGTLPLEWPIDPDTGLPNIDDADAVPMPGGKVKFINRRIVRKIETSITDERGVGAQSAGFMELDLGSNVRLHGETDAQFLDRINDWIAKSGDPRIEQYGVYVEQGNPFPIPFARWDDLKAETLIDTVATAYMGDDHEANLAMLRNFAGYELRRREEAGGPRQDVLDGLEFLATAVGDEDDDDAIIED